MDRDALFTFLTEEKGFDPRMLNAKLDRLEKAKKQKPQSTLEAFFGKPIKKAGSLKKGKKKATKSKKKKTTQKKTIMK